MARHAYGEKASSLDKAENSFPYGRIRGQEPTQRQRLLDHGRVTEAKKYLEEILSRPCEQATLTYSSIGHSHLDLLFLWPQQETPEIRPDHVYGYKNDGPVSGVLVHIEPGPRCISG